MKNVYVDEVSPRWGSVEGSTTVTFTGEGFGTTVADVSVEIDGISCAISSVIDTEVVCVTGSRPGLYTSDPMLEIRVANKGKADTLGNIFRYVSLWSQDSTWGGRFAPADGESVVVPSGLDLLVDIDASPMLNMVLVDGGSIIFPSDSNPDHERTFDAKVIMVRNGIFEAGTESDPYSSKLTITMHGEKYDPTIPIYGNKVLGIRYSTLDLHGLNRSDSWTNLDSAVTAGANSITLIKSVDWQAGEKIMITSTSFSRSEAEERTISATSDANGKTTLFLDAPLSFDHYAGVDTYGTDTIEIRAEVALMTRNVIFQGDNDSLANEYGAHILIHAPGDNTNTGRISNVQFQNVGQFGQMGRYPVHFHMDGKVHDSYIMNNVFLNSINRGTTLHGVQYLRIIGNVYYNTKGHTIFVEDGVETRNRVEYNLVIKTEPSFSLLNTDSTPACFWLTNPDNILVGNVCAGSDHYGFWYDLVPNPTGPSTTNTRCPINEKLGEFRGNVAHSLENYGLRIFHGHSPRTNPCSGISYDFNAAPGTDPYGSNPLIQAVYEDFTAYKC